MHKARLNFGGFFLFVVGLIHYAGGDKISARVFAAAGFVLIVVAYAVKEEAAQQFMRDVR